MSLFNPSRDQVRAFFFDAWRKASGQIALTDLEKIVVRVIHMHPEYHDVIDQSEHYQQVDYFPELGETNPFLHMSLHLSILEQISINQPIGITEIYQKLLQKHQDEHNAQHDILDCLAETIWLAQHNNTGLDSANYLQLMKKKLLS